jgi:coatomer protein complex subunit gamma
LAITTLLKTGNEGSIDRLMKQISSFMSEIGDEFKIVVVKAIRELCTKYPAKHRVMVSFLATFLREEGGYDFKKAIVDSIVELMTTIPDTKETSLLHLCEFIEDCEFSELIVQILHLIGTTGPLTSSPSRYIRFIFNRVILENAVVRAAAVATLGVFATRVKELRPSIIVLLRRSLQDEDDEVVTSWPWQAWEDIEPRNLYNFDEESAESAKGQAKVLAAAVLAHDGAPHPCTSPLTH